MVHQPHHVISGQTTDILIKATKAEHTRTTLRDIIAKHSGRSAGEVIGVLERDTYMTAAEAVTFGLADEVITHIGELGVPTKVPSGDEGGGGEKASNGGE